MLGAGERKFRSHIGWRELVVCPWGLVSMENLVRYFGGRFLFQVVMDGLGMRRLEPRTIPNDVSPGLPFKPSSNHERSKILLPGLQPAHPLRHFPWRYPGGVSGVPCPDDRSRWSRHSSGACSGARQQLPGLRQTSCGRCSALHGMRPEPSHGGTDADVFPCIGPTHAGAGVAQVH